MSDGIQTTMPAAEAVKRFRSPPYPSIPLSRAIERAKQVYAKALHHPVGAGVIGEAWGLGLKSSGLWGHIGSLLQYGLLVDQGSGDKRKFNLSDAALRITRDADPNSPKRREAIQQAALKPPIFRELWDLFGTADSDALFKNHLVLDRQEAGKAPFSDAAAADVIKAYRDTISFAGLMQSDSIPEASGDTASSFVPSPETQDASMAQAATASTASPKPHIPPLAPPAAIEAPGPGEYRLAIVDDRIRIAADVDLRGAKELVKKLQRRIELLEEEAGDEAAH